MLRKIVGTALALWCLTSGPAFAHVGQGTWLVSRMDSLTP
jgi:hypothetical protein